MRIGDKSLREAKHLEKKVVLISIADIQTKVVKEVTVSPIRMCRNAWLIGIILIAPYLLTLSIWIQITIHPLAIAGAIVI